MWLVLFIGFTFAVKPATDVIDDSVINLPPFTNNLSEKATEIRAERLCSGMY